MKVYHGSYKKIEYIDLTLCRPRRDFGRGFYVTKFLHHAKNWSINVGRKHGTEGIVTEFDYGEYDFTRHICKIKHFENYDEAWLDFVAMNRNIKNPEPTHDYDIVEGPVADDKVQNRIDEYLNGKISKTDFLNELKYHEPTHQICFCTFNSLQTINPITCDQRLDVTSISEPLLETLMLEKNLNEVEATDLFYTSKTFTKLADESTSFYRKSLQEIYDLLKHELYDK
jgi:hypothetical protein